jgi:hypothetical protein
MTLDQAISQVTATEATYIADAKTVDNIQTSIATATAPLASAQSTVASDITAFNASLDTLAATAIAAKIAVAA